MTTESEMAWAAGLFEGEGCIGIIGHGASVGNRIRPWVKLTVQMTDRDVLERFFSIVESGGVSLHHRANRPRHKDCWSWQAGARSDVERILLAFLPWFGERRAAKAREALALIKDLRIVKKCDFCGDEFEAYRENQRFCSNKHQQASWLAASKASGDRAAYYRDYYQRNREAALERARKQRERAKA